VQDSSSGEEADDDDISTSTSPIPTCPIGIAPIVYATGLSLGDKIEMIRADLRKQVKLLKQLHALERRVLQGIRMTQDTLEVHNDKWTREQGIAHDKVAL